MKVKQLLLFAVMVFCLGVAEAQSNWEDVRGPFEITEEEASHPLLYLYREIRYDYLYDSLGQLLCDIGHHVILRANNDNALTSVNKIYIPTSDVIEIRQIRARTISPEGKILELDQGNIKEVVDEESESGYRIFAVEGAEVGGEIEYSYVMRTPASTFVWQLAQYDAPMRQLDFRLQSPENLIFEFFVANDTAQVRHQGVFGENNLYGVTLKDVPAFQSESFSGGEANKVRIEGKLAYNTYSGGRRLNTFADAGRKIFETAHRMTKAEEKAFGAFMKENVLNGLAPIEQLKHLEHEVKTKFYEEELASDNLESLFSNRFGHRRAFLKLFVGVLEELQIPYEIVTTCERTTAKFASAFDNWKYLDDFLIYLPQEETYFTPHHTAYRYGRVPPHLTAQEGLFVGSQVITDFEYPVSRISYIPEVRYSANMSNQELEISFNDDLSENNVRARLINKGDEAFFYKTALFWITPEQKEDMLRDMVRYLATDADISDIGIEQEHATTDTWLQPFVVQATLTTASFLERAGPALLFKLGEVIGMQSELYQEEVRRFDVENANNRAYQRRITVELPAGFTVQNLDDIIINKEVRDDEGVAFLFKSAYELVGNTLTVSIDEYYDRIYFPRVRFEEFRQVINAAADWNKVTLVLRPNG